MEKSTIIQLHNLLLAEKDYRETTEKLIAAAQKYDPNIKTRAEALILVEKIKQGQIK